MFRAINIKLMPGRPSPYWCCCCYCWPRTYLGISKITRRAL